MGIDSRKYIVTQLAQIRGRLTLPEAAVMRRMKKDELGRFLWVNQRPDVLQALANCKNEHLGNIAACGLGELALPHQGTRMCDVVEEMSLKGSGEYNLTTLAAAAVIAALTDQVWAELQKAKEEAAKPKKAKSERYTCPYCTFTSDWPSDLFHGVKLGAPYGDGLTPWRKIVFHIALSHEDRVKGDPSAFLVT